MQVSLNWLNELVDIKDIDVNQIAHELTMSGLEVEEIEEVKPKFTNIITARIEKIDNHPNSDRLHLVTVNTGTTNVKTNWIIVGKNTFGLLSILVKSSITPPNELALASQKLKHMHILFNKKIIICPILNTIINHNYTSNSKYGNIVT